MEFAAEQVQSIEHGDAVPLVVGDTECVVVRRDVFNQCVSYDDFDPEEAYPLIEAALEDDPGLDAYQQYKS